MCSPQVIVAVTEGWNVLCYDRDLNLLWERAVDADLSNKYLGEVAILITSHRMRVCCPADTQSVG